MTAVHHADDTEIRIFHQSVGWTLPFLSPDIQDCTANYTGERESTLPCMATATWKVVELRGLGATISFWCDGDLPNELREME